MNNRHKIQAFTLSEVLVVLVITSIVVAIAFSVLRLVTKQIQAIQTSYEKQTTLVLFKQQLLQDFERSVRVSWNPDIDVLELNQVDNTVSYELTEAYVVREQDTLSLTVAETTYYYKGLLVTEGAVDAIDLGFSFPGKVTTIFVQRAIGAQEELEQVWD